MRVVRIKTRRERSRARRRTMASALLALGCLLAVGGWRMTRGEWQLPVFSVRFSDNELAETVSREIVLTLNGWYALEIGAFDNRAEAQKHLDALVSRGDTGVIRSGAETAVWCDLMPTRAEALSALERLKASSGEDGVVRELPALSMILRVTGEVAQLDVLSDAHQYLASAPARLYALENSNAGPQGASAALVSERDTCLSLAKALSRAFPEPKPDAARMLIALFDTLALEMCAEDASLIQKIKRCRLLCAAEALDYASGLR